MLEQVCNFIHNYFEWERHEGTFTISGGSIELPFLLEGQRFRILGSALNDGIYTYSTNGIHDDDNNEGVSLMNETFTGVIVGMAVPKVVLDLVNEINTWVAANAESLNSPYTSESFGGYSYTKASGAGANGTGGGAFTWQDQFRSRLNAYRKIA